MADKSVSYSPYCIACVHSVSFQIATISNNCSYKFNWKLEACAWIVDSGTSDFKITNGNNEIKYQYRYMDINHKKC